MRQIGGLARPPAVLRALAVQVRGRLNVAVCTALLLLASAARASDPITLNFVNADIEAVANAVAQISKRNFLLDPRVKGTVNIVSSRPVPASAVYDIFLSALRLQGFTAVDGGAGVTKIVPEADAKLHVRGVTARDAMGGDRIATQVYVLKYESANQLLPVLRPLISPNNTIAAYPNNNSLVITDYADNLRRIDLIVEAIDRPGAGESVVLPLRHASASELAQTLTRLLSETSGGGAEPATRVVIAPDLRTNSLVVRSDNFARVARVQRMVQQLDVPTSTAGNIHVVYLKNAEAARVAQTLRAILGGDSGAFPPAATPVQAGGGGAAAPSGIVTTAAAQATSASAGPAAANVQADLASNALIISAPDAVFASLRDVIAKLDVRRAQVYVEALIVEVTSDKAAEFGIQWQALNNLSSTDARVIGGTNFGARGGGANIIDGAVNLGTVGQGLNIGIVKGQVTIPGIGTVTNLAALARALETDAKANILSTPNLLTLDNEEAKIVIGQNVPFITGQYAQTGSVTTATPFQTIERRDVGLTLRIKPQISEGGAVRLQIYQEVSSVQDRSNVAGIITNKRSIESTVLVDDGEIIALGGLVQDTTSAGVDKIPGLGDLPIVGGLFRYETRKQTKTNLMVFLRPLVVRDDTAYRGPTAERYRQLLGEQQRARPAPHPLLPHIDEPLLPPLAPPATDKPLKQGQ